MAKKRVFDRNILIIVGFILLIALVIVVFKVLTKPRGNCPSLVKFSWSDDYAKSNSPLTFIDSTEGAVKWDWDFGDTLSPAHAYIKNPTHIYNNPGDYTVILTVNDCAKDSLRVHISPATSDSVPQLPRGKIDGPKTATVGQSATFSDISGIAKSWSWEFGETGVTDAKTQTATYKFLRSGLHHVTLNINDGKCTTVNWDVYVQGASTATEPVKPNQKAAAHIIETRDFIAKMNELSNPDKSYLAFEKYLADGNTGMNITVLNEKGAKPWIFSSYCRQFYLVNNVITGANLTWDKNGKINSITITEEKSSK